MITWRIPTLGNRWQELAQVLDRQTTSAHDVKHCCPDLFFSLLYLIVMQIASRWSCWLVFCYVDDKNMCMHLCLTWTRLFTLAVTHAFTAASTCISIRDVHQQCDYCVCSFVIAYHCSVVQTFVLRWHSTIRSEAVCASLAQIAAEWRQPVVNSSSPPYNDVTGLLTNQRTYCPTSAVLVIY